MKEAQVYHMIKSSPIVTLFYWGGTNTEYLVETELFHRRDRFNLSKCFSLWKAQQGSTKTGVQNTQ